MEITKRAIKSSLLTEAILSPTIRDSEWQYIEVVTLRQHLIDTAVIEVLTNTVTMSDVNRKVHDLLQTPEYSIYRECVIIDESAIVIVIDCDVVNDITLDRAIYRLANVSELSDGVHFTGEEIEYDFGSYLSDTNHSDLV